MRRNYYSMVKFDYSLEKKKYKKSGTFFRRKIRNNFGKLKDDLCDEEYLIDDSLLDSVSLESDLFSFKENDTLEGDYFYHGLRLGNNLEKLESIFSSQAIFAGKFLPNYISYSDNCNEGEYVSLMSDEGKGTIEFDTFILEGVSLLISPQCEAIKTEYLPFDVWEKKKLEWNNLHGVRYSYARGEYQVKNKIDFSLVKGIGIPYTKWRFKDLVFANNYRDLVISLMEEYGVFLPLVDTTDSNKLLYKNEKVKVKGFSNR